MCMCTSPIKGLFISVIVVNKENKQNYIVFTIITSGLSMHIFSQKSLDLYTCIL